ncbi:MAG: ATP-binding cassette domain-containing protein, partial [Betaproteobacteria bacterium]|nr:ATP-binding cassette domain-containing protein [Betaproteobacteria bacterium]
MALLEVEQLQVAYGGIKALKGISFAVEQGELVSLLGANGAGKTTSLKAITALHPKSSGLIRFQNRDTDGIGAWELASRGLVMVPEGRGSFTRMTIVENLQMGAYLRRDPQISDDMDKVFALFPRLKERRKQLAGT